MTLTNKQPLPDICIKLQDLSSRKAWVRCPMPPNTLRVHTDLHAEIVEVDIEVVSPSIVPSGNFAELNRTVTCMVLKANDWRTSCPCQDEFCGPRSDYVRQNIPEDTNSPTGSPVTPKKSSKSPNWQPTWLYCEDFANCSLNRLYNLSSDLFSVCGLAIHQNDHQARRRFVEWTQNEIAVAPDFHKRILFSDEAHFWLNGYVNKQNCRIWSEANPQVYVETPLHPEN
ncbi:hypothetical protein TNCV_3515261 [Trichonephila clavipes]|nr:hypothetical protein TNCV_3515261 [Trichonephila clavipes]